MAKSELVQSLLTEPQRKIVEFFRNYAQEHKRAPTLQEIADGVGRSVATIHSHVAHLCEKGVMERVHKGRGQRLVLYEDLTYVAGLQERLIPVKHERSVILLERLNQMTSSELDALWPGLAKMVS